MQSGTRGKVLLPLPRLPAGPDTALPVVVLHGKRDGPSAWVSAAIHGDELNGVEIVRRVLRRLNPARMSGTLYAVPVVNVFGVATESRYLPDRRDLNRSFPGSRRGSLAARLAHVLITNVVSRCEVGLDLHTGSNHRYNLPHLRCDLDDPEIRRLAQAFGPQLAINSARRRGTLRAAAAKLGARVLLFEGGVSMRYDEPVIEAGTAGTLRTLAALGMIREVTDEPAAVDPLVPPRSAWMRASRGGFLRVLVEPGETVEARQVVGEVHDYLGRLRRRLRAPRDGIVIGKLLNPMVYQGDAVLHLGDLDGSWPLSKGPPPPAKRRRRAARTGPKDPVVDA